MSQKKIYLNKPQLLANIVQPKEGYYVMGRGTGKSEGIIAPAVIRNITNMPRSLGANVGSTFSQILTRTLPAVVKAWENMGYQRDVHYFIGDYAPKSWNWPRPFFSPLNAKYFIHWFTGAGIQMISQDGHGMANGMSVDYLHGDEAKLINYPKLKSEVLPILRGNRDKFGHLPEHHSMIFTTDRPTSSTGQWILEKASQNDPELVKLIIDLHATISHEQERLGSLTARTQAEYLKKIKRMEKQLALLRMQCVYYLEASSVENAAVLGLDFFKQMKRNLSDFEFNTSILNLPVREQSKSFYPLLNDDHYYESYNYSHFEEVGYNFSAINTPDCRKDGDLLPDKEIDIAIDYNASINIMAIGQQHRSTFRIINELFVKPPKVLEDLMDEFIRYYRFHKHRVVNYHYDHTAVGKSAASRKSYRDIVVDKLKAAGWQVNTVNMGQAPGHEEKYRFWNALLAEKSKDLPKFLLNSANCPSIKKSMEDAPWRQTDEGFKKDKRSERNPHYDQAYATHASDATDQLVWSKLRAGYKKADTTFIPTVFG